MALRMVTNPDGTLTVIDTTTGRSIQTQQQPVSTPSQVPTQSTVYGDLEKQAQESGIVGAAAYSLYKTGAPVVQQISEAIEAEEKRAGEIESPFIREPARFLIGVGKGIVLPTAATIVYGPEALVSAAKQPGKFVEALAPATEMMVTETIEAAQKSPAGFAGEIAGMVALGKAGGKITGKITGKPPKSTGIPKTDELLMETPPLEGTKLSTGMPRSLDKTSDFTEFTSSQKVKLTSDTKLPELGIPPEKSFIVEDNPLAGQIVETPQRGVTTPQTRTGAPVEVKPTETTVKGPFKEPIPDEFAKIPVITEERLGIVAEAGRAETKYIDSLSQLSEKYKPPSQKIDVLTSVAGEQTREMALQKGGIREVRPTRREYELQVAEIEYEIRYESGISKKYKPPSQERDILVETVKGQTQEMALRKVIESGRGKVEFGEVIKKTRTKAGIKPESEIIEFMELDFETIFDVPDFGKKPIYQIGKTGAGRGQLLEVKPQAKPTTKPKTKTTSDIITKVKEQQITDLTPTQKRTTKQITKTIFDTRQEQPLRQKTRTKAEIKPESEIIEFMELDLRQPQVSLPAQKPVSKQVIGVIPTVKPTTKAKQETKISSMIDSVVDTSQRQDDLVTQIIDSVVTPKPVPKTKPDQVPDFTIDITPPKIAPTRTEPTKTKKTPKRATPKYEQPKQKRRKPKRLPDIEEEAKRKKKSKKRKPKYKGWKIRNPYIGIKEFTGKL